MTVQLGDTGPEVTELQTGLAALHFPITIDGVFGARTDDAVRGAQLVTGLVVDGIFGPITHTTLFTEPGGWAEVAVNANPQLTLERILRTDTQTMTATITVYEADVRFPKILMNPTFFNATVISETLASDLEAIISGGARSVPDPSGVGGASFIRGEIEATDIAPTLIGLHGNLSEFFTGAAHPNPQVFARTVDVASNQYIAAADLWMPGTPWLDTLRTLALTHFPAGPGLDAVFTNYKHQTVTPDGIKVIFDPFQILPGVAGAPDFVAPWADIEHIARPSIVARARFGSAGGPGPHVA